MYYFYFTKWSKMKISKAIILDTARKLYNEKGYASVSYRQLARALGISHSNLIYHFKDKQALIEALHDQILAAAMTINQEITEADSLMEGLVVSVVRGFEVMYEYRFFMLDFNYILAANTTLRDTIRQIESVRYEMYDRQIAGMVATGIMRERTYEREYTDLIECIRVYSDYWISSAHVYEADPAASVRAYARLFITMFYPYLTEVGRAQSTQAMASYGLEL